MPLIPTQEPPYYQISTGPGPAGTQYYTALISQTGTSTPIATILQNTSGGTVTIGRAGIGQYTITWPETITGNPWISGMGGYNDTANPFIALSDGAAIQGYYTMYQLTDTVIRLDIVDETFAAADLSTICGASFIFYMPEIRIYPA